MGHTLSFRARLTLRWTAAFGLLLAGVLIAVYAGSSTFAYHDFDTQVRTLAATELASSTDQGQGAHLHDFPAKSLGTSEFAGKFAQLYAGDGSLLAQSPLLEGTGFRLPPETLAAGLRGEAPLAAVRVGDRPGRVAALLASEGDRPFVIAVGLFADSLEATLRRLGWLLLGTWFVGVALTALIGYALASRALAPINSITQRAAAVARGDFAARLDPPALDDEIGRMTTLLNEMLERLHGAVEANRRFAADASHELRSPLTAMAGEIDVTLKRHRTVGEYRETLELVRERLRELSALTENLMVLARAQEQSSQGIVREVSVVPLVEAAARRLDPLARARRVRLRFEAFPPLVVYGDDRLLARVFDNLIANAIQYNRDDGEVVVRGRVEDAAPEAWEAPSAILTISDTGQGIPREEWERIFQRFHRLDGSRSRLTGGTGLGLSISEAIVRLFGGRIRVADSTPHGTTFEIRLPGRLGSEERRTGAIVELEPSRTPDAAGGPERPALRTHAGTRI